MSLLEDFIAADVVLQRVFFDERNFAPFPGKEPDANILLSRITERKAALFKVQSIEAADRLMLGDFRRVKARHTAAEILEAKLDQRALPKWRRIRIAGIREMYFQLRDICDGYRFPQLELCGDGCEHVIVFAHDRKSDVFRPDFKQRFWLWKKYANRNPINQPGGRWI